MKKTKCEHKWIPNGMVKDTIVIVVSIICEKCGKIKFKTFDPIVD